MDSALYDIIGSVKIPNMIRVKQKFDPHEITDPEPVIRQELSRPAISSTIRPRGCGSPSRQAAAASQTTRGS